MILELKHEYKLGILLDIANLSRSTFYYYSARLSLPDKYGTVKEAIQKIHQDNHSRYGYRRITAALHLNGYKVNHKTVFKLMKQLKIVCNVRMKKYHSYKGDVGRIAPNLLKRDFEANKPNEKWVTDVTEFKLFGQKLYLSTIMDLYSRDIVSYTLSNRPTLAMVTDMLDNALAELPQGCQLILHSDQGWQYQHKDYQSRLKAHSVLQSMSRKANCLDNAVIENFFGLLKIELLYLCRFESMDQFKNELIKYIDYYNNHRIKLKLNGLPPVVHRKLSLSLICPIPNPIFVQLLGFTSPAA